MNTMQIQKTKKNQKINNVELRNLCKQMVRKDLEIYRIQNSMMLSTGDISIFSKSDDELSSIRHTIMLATGTSSKEFEKSNFLKSVTDASTMLILSLHNGFNWPVKNISRATSNLVDIIFSASKEIHDSSRESKFKRDMKECFSGIFGDANQREQSYYLREEMLTN